MGIIATVGSFDILSMAGGFRVHGSGLSRHALPVSVENATLPTLAGAVALASCASANEGRTDDGAYHARLARCVLRHGGALALAFSGITPVVS